MLSLVYPLLFYNEHSTGNSRLLYMYVWRWAFCFSFKAIRYPLEPNKRMLHKLSGCFVMYIMYTVNQSRVWKDLRCTWFSLDFTLLGLFYWLHYANKINRSSSIWKHLTYMYIWPRSATNHRISIWLVQDGRHFVAGFISCLEVV